MSTRPETAPEKEIFLAALERREPAERAAYLDRACAGAAGLRRAVEQMLREAEDVGSFLETPAVRDEVSRARQPGSVEPAPEDASEKPGDVIGSYKLLQKIGEGGCGSVYMAEQEQPVRRRVALKIIKLGMDTRQVIARFEAERQACALMDHPNIARVLEAGATQTGRPYFVMELVRGIKITEYCDQNKLSTEQRLNLFIQVCSAIQHAHQKGIIHRDVKPSNILITSHDGKPVPKVIDFGIAKATHQQKLTDLTIFTAYDQFIGTPAYMSPEQAEMSGLDIDTRSDIYSLGVLLYELLTGRPPFDPAALVRNGLEQCRRTIREVEPVWPSTRVSTMLRADLSLTANLRSAEAPRLIHLLRGDLDWIVMKAIEKDRTRRYATANDLALDVERYLKDEAVMARPQSGWYRLSKLLRRHRTAVAAAGAIGVTLVAGVAFSTWQAFGARDAKLQAQAAQQMEAKLRRQAELEGMRAREQAALAHLNEYVAHINLAQQQLAAGNFGRAVQLLQKHRPQPSDTAPPGFEWRYLWQLSRGDEHLALPNQEGAVQAAVFSPSGDLLAIALPEKLVILDARTHATVTSLPRRVYNLGFLADGKSLVAAGPGSVRVYNTTDWSEQRTLERQSSPIALSKDGSRLATSSREGIRVFDTATWETVQWLEDARGSMEFSRDGGRLAVASPSGILVHDLSGSRPPLPLDNSTNLGGFGPWLKMGRSMTFSPDGASVVGARNLRSNRGLFVLSVWDSRTGKEIATLPPEGSPREHTGMIASLDLSPDGQTLATASMDHSIRLWNLSEKKLLYLLHAHLNEVWTVAFSPDGKTLLSGAKDGGLKLWPLRRQKKEEIWPAAGLPLRFSADGRTLAALSPQKDAILFLNVATGEPERQFRVQPKRFPWVESTVSLNADLSLLAEGCEDGTVKLLGTRDGESVVLKAGDGPVGMASLSPDGRQLITGSFQQSLRWWDLRDGKSITLDARARRVSFSPDNRTLAVFGMEAGLQLWDATTRTIRTNLVFENSSFGNVVFSPDSRLLATTSGPDDYEHAIRLWDTAKGRMVGTFVGHKQSVFSVAFAPDARTLASASDDGTMKLWNIATQQELVTAHSTDAGVRDLLFSPDGTLLVGANRDFRESSGLRLFRAPMPVRE